LTYQLILKKNMPFVMFHNGHLQNNFQQFTLDSKGKLISAFKNNQADLFCIQFSSPEDSF